MEDSPSLETAISSAMILPGSDSPAEVKAIDSSYSVKQCDVVQGRPYSDGRFLFLIFMWSRSTDSMPRTPYFTHPVLPQPISLSLAILVEPHFKTIFRGSTTISNIFSVNANAEPSLPVRQPRAMVQLSGKKSAEMSLPPPQHEPIPTSSERR